MKKLFNLIAQFLKNNWKQLLLLITLIVLFFIFCFDSHISRFWISLKSFGQSFKYYFQSIYLNEDDIRIPPTSLDNLIAENGGSILNLIPIDFDAFWKRLPVFLALMINPTFWSTWWTGVSLTLNKLILVMNLLVVFFMIVFILKKNRKYIENDVPEVTKALKKYLTLKDKIRPKICLLKNVLNNFFKKWLKVSILVLLICYLNLPILALDIFSNYFYFLAGFDLNIIWQSVLLIALDFLPGYFSIPLIIRLIALYLIFDFIRIRNANNRLQDILDKDISFLEETGNAVLITGASGVGKNAVATCLTLIYGDIMLPNMLLGIMQEIERKFPFANYDAFAKLVDDKSNSKDFRTQDDIYNYFSRLNVTYKKTKDLSLYFYPQNEQFENWDELTIEKFSQAITDWCLAYFFYRIKDPLSVSNYTIIFNSKENNDSHYFNVNKTDMLQEDIDDYLDRHNNKIINFDYLRIGKKMDTYAANQDYIPDIGVYSITEVGKERGDTETLKNAKRDSKNVNAKNDLFNERLKIWRHASTIRFRTLFKLIMDDQQNISVNSDLRKCFENIITLDRNKMTVKTCLKSWWLESYVCKIILSNYDKYSLHRKEIKLRQSLPNYLLKKLVNCVNTYYMRRFNHYTYTECNVYNMNGSTAGVNEEVNNKTLFLINKIAYSGRYETASLKKLFLSQMRNARLSFEDLQTFEFKTPSNDEYNAMRSYFYSATFNNTSTNKEDK